MSFRNDLAELPISFHSTREADYSRDRISLAVPEVDLGIIYDVLYDRGLDDEEINNRLATITAILLTPVPTSTGTVYLFDTPVPIQTNTPIPTQDDPTSDPTATPKPVAIAPPTDPPPVISPKIGLTVGLSSHNDNDSSGSITYGDDILYLYLVVNSGNTNLVNISVTDNTFGIPVTCPNNTLAAGASMTCLANSTHTITLSEANSGSITTFGTATGNFGGSSYSDTDDLVTAISQDPSVQLVKSLDSFDDNDSSGSINLGDGLWYQFELTNEGNVTVTNLGVTDNTVGISIVCPPVSLAPGNSAICLSTSAHIVNTGDVTAGEVSNTAIGSVEFNSTTYTDSDTLIIPLSIEIVKSLASFDDNDSSGTITLGDGLWYQFVVTNIGPLLLNNIGVMDNTFGLSVTCPSTALTPGASMTCSADSTHLITLAESNTGNVQNTATVTGDPPAGPTARDTSTLDTVVIQNPSLSISKSANPSTYNTPGQTINYTFVVTNSGDVTISGPIAIADDKAINESCPAGNIDPGNSITCSASYVVTQADIDSGSVINTAFATGTDLTGNSVSSATDTATVTALQIPDINIQKVAHSYGDNDSSGTLTLGDDLWYRFDVSNTGNVTLDPISVTDDTFSIPVTCPVTSLAPGVVTSCLVDNAHTISLSEANSGQVTNTATAHGEFNSIIYTSSGTITTNITQNPALSLTKSSSPVTYDIVGQVITYTYTIENSGNVTLAGPFTVTDDKQGLLADCAAGPLDPTGTTTCTSTHTITQANIDAGSITNTATVSGNSIVSTPYSLTVNAVHNPALALTKSADLFFYFSVGEVITYTYDLRNSGNVTLNGPFNISDDKAGIVDPCGSGPLVPGATTNCSATYTTTQFDLDFGSVTNSAIGNTTFSGNPVASNQDSVTIPALQTPSYTITTIVTDVDGGGPGGNADQAGDVISYQISLLNTGNVSLVGVNVSDPLLGALAGPTESGVTDGILGVGETWTYTGGYSVSQVDMDTNGGGDGNIDNTVSSTTTFLPIPQTASAMVPIDQLPALTLDKTSSNPDYDEAGDTIDYNYQVTNSGNQTLAGPVTVNDSITTVTCPPLTTIGDFDTDLDVGESITCTANYTVSQADLDAGSVTNTASATIDGIISNIDSVTVIADQNPAMTVDKTSATTNLSAPGTVTYDYLVANTGNVTLTGISLSDDNDNNDMNCPSTTLAVSSNMSCTATHTFTQAELDAGGNLINNVTASSNEAPDTLDSLSIPIIQTPELTLTKNAVPLTYDTVGQIITYTYSIENTGNTTLAGPFTITDDKQGTLTDCATGPLAPAAVTPCVSTHSINAADITAGSITNTATASGNSIISNSDNATTTYVPTLNISGQVRYDKNGDGNLGSPDPSMASIFIELDDGSCTLGSDCSTTYTDSSGNYIFDNLAPGSYTILETDPSGFVSTADSNGGNDNQIAVTLIAGTNSTGNDFLDTAASPTIPTCAPLTTTGIAPSDDSYIGTDNKIANHGGEVTIQVDADEDHDYRGLLKFDLSSIPGNATITSAYLYLYTPQQDDEIWHRILRVTSDWNENTVTWNTPWSSPGGDYDNSIRYNQFQPNNNDCLFTIDLAYLVQLWVNGTYNNYGLMIFPTGEDGQIQYYSKEFATTDRRPRLEVNYTVP